MRLIVVVHVVEQVVDKPGALIKPGSDNKGHAMSSPQGAALVEKHGDSQGAITNGNIKATVGAVHFQRTTGACAGGSVSRRTPDSA